jgi:SAM-dependent methyltransferase
MVAHCRARRIGGDRATFRTGDAELPSSLPRDVDLVASNCAVQWFSDLPGAFRSWAASLRPGGILALAALVRGTFPELAAAHEEAFGAPFPGLEFPDPGLLADAVRSSGLAIRSAERVDSVSAHADAREAFRSFRKIGARLPGRAPLAHGEMRRLLAAMGRQGSGAGEVTLTHRAIVLIAEKEG